MIITIIVCFMITESIFNQTLTPIAFMMSVTDKLPSASSHSHNGRGGCLRQKDPGGHVARLRGQQQRLGEVYKKRRPLKEAPWNHMCCSNRFCLNSFSTLPPLKQPDPLGLLFSPKFSHFFKTAVLTMGMDILTMTMVKHYS